MSEKKYNFTRSERSDALKAFKACKPFLWNGRHPVFNNNVTAYICHALDAAANNLHIDKSAARVAQRIVTKSLSGQVNYASWLRTHGDKETRKYMDRFYVNPAENWRDYYLFVQRERHRWVDTIIRQLKESLK